MVKRCILFVAFTACLDHEVLPCDDGTVCQIGQVCGPSGGCAFEAFRDACNGVAENTACTAENPETEKTESGKCVSGVCTVGVCGDGVITAPEVCDDGNTLDGDACSSDCTTAT